MVSGSACGGTSQLESEDTSPQVLHWKDVFDREAHATCPAETPTGSAVCSADFGSKYPLQSDLQVSGFRLGQWRVCSGSFFEPGDYLKGPVDVAGIEFLADGSFVLLRQGPDGTLVRGAGLDYEGTVVPGLNGPTSFFLRTDAYTGQKTTGYQVILVGSLCPLKMRLQKLGGSDSIELAPELD